ncbi:sensor histidine kinase [Clostridium estertheticum]|uniref:sensor histidine kinase n=1 Tax=Clostridium estertheticum TaxID=238834 RepID=UPI001C0C1E06|nr:sensor histidine kinase [Clostridium estertheticum]MBU3074775.1 sensor histidine kinase [Clostridium estertheticum]MBU3164990.1 sensor histidine kinase [Clostridium estertheticum]MBU3173924.1 sensor histidine kinase [Clostridium estertheticum]
MGKNYVWTIVISYCMDKIKTIIKFLVFIMIFFIVYSLYHLPVEPILYATLLSATLAFLFSIYDFKVYYDKHMTLQDILSGIQFELGKIPKAKTLIEKDYQSIITTIYKEKSEVLYNTDNKLSEMVDYYTMWAHQIKTPIAAFSMIIQSMQVGIEKKLMEQELFKIEQYVEMVLHYIRLGNLSSDLKLEIYSLYDIIRKTVKKYAATFIYKKISLNLKEFDCKVITDDKWITFVIEQILSNALKYTKGGSISIYIEGYLEKTLIIEDTGIGIAPEDIPRVFERGFTGYNGRMDKKSTGIGLYLCKEIITRLSHKISMTSEIGKGTKVAIDFLTDKINIE